jgi:hypothetical protein
MNLGKFVFAQVMEHLPLHVFPRCVVRYSGEHKAKWFSCLDQYLCMPFSQLTYETKVSTYQLLVGLLWKSRERALQIHDSAATSHAFLMRAIKNLPAQSESDGWRLAPSSAARCETRLPRNFHCSRDAIT